MAPAWPDTGAAIGQSDAVDPAQRWIAGTHCGAASSSKGFVDWDAAGRGAPGIDLVTMRLDVAFIFGAEAMDEVVAGWSDMSGRSVVDLAYWNLVAALTSPVDLAQWLPDLQRLGRADLDGATLALRWEESVRRALTAI